MRLPSTISGSARRRWSLSAHPISTATEGRSNVLAMRWPPTRSESSTLAPLEQHARHLGGQVGLAAAALGLLRAAARGAGERLVTTAATRKTTSATQFSPVGDREPPVGGMWKKLNARALSTAVARPIHRPQ